MTEQVITTNDVTIKQAVVEVKVLKIGKRQVTQAVFKQLPEEPVINPATGDLLGNVWGRVNYHVGCDDIAEHFHVVWQKGNELKRGIAFLPWRKVDLSEHLPRSFYNSVRAELHRRYFQYLAAKTLKGWKPEYLGWEVGREIDWTFVSTRFIDILNREALVDVWHSMYEHSSWDWDSTLRSLEFHKLRQRLKQAGVIHIDALNEESIHADMIDIAKAAKPIMTRWQQSYDQLQQLDQLFIAV